jgi:hypothetical protein
MSKNFLGVFPKLIPRTIHSKHINITKEKLRLKFALKILLRTNAEFFPWNNSDILLVNTDLNWKFS